MAITKSSTTKKVTISGLILISVLLGSQVLASADIQIIDRDTGLPLKQTDVMGPCGGNMLDRCLKNITFMTNDFSLYFTSTVQLYSDNPKASVILWDENMTRIIGRSSIKGIKSSSLTIPVHSSYKAVLEVRKGAGETVKYTVGNIDPVVLGYDNSALTYTDADKNIAINTDQNQSIVDIKLIEANNLTINFDPVFLIYPHIDINTSFNNYSSGNVHESGNPVQSVSFFLLVTENQTTDVEATTCKPTITTTSNLTIVTENNCTITTKSLKVPVTYYKLIDISNYLFKANTSYQIRMSARRKLVLGSQISDVFPIIEGFDLSDYFVWWNSNYAVKNNVTFEDRTGSNFQSFVFNATFNISSNSAKSCADPVWVNTSENEALVYELEDNTCNNSAINNSYYWVKVNGVSNGNQTNYLYYRSSSPTDTSNTCRTWNSSFTAVIHGGDTASFQKNSACTAIGNATGDKNTLHTNTGMFGRGFSMSGNSTTTADIGINITYSSNLVAATSWAVTLWIKPTGDLNTAGQTLFGTSADTQINANLYQGTGTSMRVYGPSGCDSLGSNLYGEPTDGVWTYLVVKYDGARIYVYYNGVLKGTKACTASTDTTAGQFLFGSGGSGGLEGYNGQMDEMRVMKSYNLTDAEINATYNDGIVRFNALLANTVDANVTILDPTNATRINNTFYINTTSNASFDKMWYSLNFTGGAFSVNTTFTPNTTNNTGDGSYQFRVCVNGTSGNTFCSFVNFTIANFNVTITAPTNTTYISNNITVRSFSNKQLFSNGSYYSLNDGVNTTFNGNGTLIAGDGSNKLYVWYNMTQPTNATNRTVFFTVNRTASTVNITIKLNDLSQNRSYEDGTVANISVTTTSGTVCLDVNYPGIGVNTTCNANGFVYNLTPREYKQSFGDRTTSRIFGTSAGGGSGTVINAMLYFKNKENYSRANYSVYQVYASNWTETTLTWEKQPCGQTAMNITTANCNSTTTGYVNYNNSDDLMLNVTPFVTEALLNNRTNVSFLVQVNITKIGQPSGNNFWSKDSGDTNLMPKLVVTFSNGTIITLQTNATEHFADVTVSTTLNLSGFETRLIVAEGSGPSQTLYKVYDMWNMSLINSTYQGTTSRISLNQTALEITHHKYDLIVGSYYLNLTCIAATDITIYSNLTNYSKLPGFCYGGNTTLNYISTGQTSPTLSFFGTNFNRFNLTVPSGKNITNANITIYPTAGYNETIFQILDNLTLTDATYEFCGSVSFFNVTATRVNFTVCPFNLSNISSVGWANVVSLEFHGLNITINASSRGYLGGNLSGLGGMGSGAGGNGTNSTDTSTYKGGGGGGGAASYATTAISGYGNGGGTCFLAPGNCGSGGSGGSSGNTYGSFLTDDMGVSKIGSGGGAGGSTSSGSIVGGNGGAGGGGVRIRAQFINLTNAAILAQGGNGGAGGNGQVGAPNQIMGGGGGGGASGGAIILSAQYLQLRNVSLNVTGGLGGCGGLDPIGFSDSSPACHDANKNGTQGGYGRISLFYNTLQQNISVNLSGPNVFTVQGFPVNVSIDVFNDGLLDFNFTGTMSTNQSMSINTTSFKSYLLSCTPDSYGVCTVPSRIFSLGQGRIQLQNINITYEQSPIILNSTKLSSELNMSAASGFTNISMYVTMTGSGNFTMTLDRPGQYYGSAEYNITAHVAGNDSTLDAILTRFIKVQTSRFVKLLPYKFTNDTVFIPGTNSSKNVTPFGQGTSSPPIYNITYLGYDLSASVCLVINPFKCYQEHSNVSTSCGGLSTGSYRTNGTWANVDRLTDGDWTTNNNAFGNDNGHFFVNYTKPTDAVNSSTWQVKNDVIGSVNLSIPQLCFNNATLQFRIFSDNTVGNASFQCWNSTQWQDIRNSDTDSTVYEEAMWWHFGLVSFNLTASNSSAKANGSLLGTTSNLTILNQTTFNANYGIYLWADLNDTPVGSGIFTRMTRNISIISWCQNCVGRTCG